jgi:regulation of enolase protein 1 (concanavalin A-like superfamily)
VACSSGPESDQTQQGNSSTQPSTGGSSTGPAATNAGAAGPKGMPDMADIKSLSSYRLAIMSRIVEGTGSGPATYIKYEWVKDQQAEHAWMEDAGGKVQEVYISIGDRQWMYMPGMGWIEQGQAAPGPGAAASDLAEQIKQAADSRFDKKGTETVNGVKCVKYEFEYDATMETPNMATGGKIKTDMHSSGNMWIADEGGLPAVMIKSVSTAEINSSGQKSLIESEQNLTDIGASITIKPPEDAVQIPTMPTIPTGLPTGPATTTEVAAPDETETTSAPPDETETGTLPPDETETTTSPADGELSAFEDDFQGELDPRWSWTDPNDDAPYSLTARVGFLRIIAPDGNDLGAATNYDAPRLLLPRSGDFIVETALEFDPQIHYQGAGLLVWQDEDTFLRLEYGFGGLGGEAKNVVFCLQESGALSLVTSFDLPGITSSIGLRIKRDGDEFTAWYRQQGRGWTEMGSTGIAMAPTVEVGIAQVNQYTTLEIPADFDSFNISAP